MIFQRPMSNEQFQAYKKWNEACDLNDRDAALIAWKKCKEVFPKLSTVEYPTDKEFKEVSEYLFKKNHELYKRLAKH